MATLGSILGGLFLLMLGICGGLCVKSECDQAAYRRKEEQVRVADERLAQSLHPWIEKALPPTLGPWHQAAGGWSRNRMVWQVAYQDDGFEAESSFQQSAAGQAEYQAWQQATDKASAEAEAQAQSLHRAKAPQPERFQAYESMEYWRGLKNAGRNAWSQARLAPHQVLVQIGVVRKGGNDGIPRAGAEGVAIATPRLGFIREDRLVLAPQRTFQAWFWPEVSACRVRHRGWSGGWELLGGTMVPKPAPTSVQFTVWSYDERAMEAFLQGIDAQNLSALSSHR